jgi:hypothetical protein
MNFPRPDIFGNYMLKNFGDIVMPENLPWWPIQPGWWVVLSLLLLTASIFGFRRYRHWRRNAYRRQALSELSNMASPRQMTAIVKRAATAAFPSDAVTELWGRDWVGYLNSKTETPCFCSGDELLFNVSLCGPEGSWPDNINTLREHVLLWLQQHKEESL